MLLDRRGHRPREARRARILIAEREVLHQVERVLVSFDLLVDM
jgi:hypothetical protein